MYKKIDVVKYVEEGLENGELKAFKAEKFARIAAVQGTVGQHVVTWSEDKNGNAIIEKEADVSVDENGNIDVVVTKLDENGNIVLDKHGHTNTWIIKHKTFIEKYELDYGMVYKPAGKPQDFVELHEDVTIHQWGDDYNISEGGYINITNKNDMYGISKRDFESTYKKINSNPKVLEKKVSE